MNWLIKIPDHVFSKNLHADHWTVSLKLSNLLFKTGERLILTYQDREYIQSRLDDWMKRVTHLYESIEDWISEKGDYKLKIGFPVVIYETVMERYNIPAINVNTADIFKGKQIVLSLKPKGLWTIGANGIINIISKTGIYSLLDNSKPFDTSEWRLYTSSNKFDSSIPINKKEFLKLL
jgi:hypothetical protein